MSDTFLFLAMHATYSTTQGIRGGPLVVHLHTVHVLQEGNLPISAGQDLTLWAQDGCMCTRMKAGRHYLILGHEDNRNNRLLLDNQTYILPWKESWIAKIQVNCISCILFSTLPENITRVYAKKDLKITVVWRSSKKR